MSDLPSPKPDRLLLAMIALDTPSLPSPAELLTTFSRFSDSAVDESTVETRETALVFEIEAGRAALALIPNPIPWSHLEGPSATAWWWPEATARMRRHNSHILVALMADSDDLIRRHVALTQITAAATAHVDAAGVFWGGGALVHEPAEFIAGAEKIDPEALPWHLWIDFRIERNEDGTHRLFTTGMKAFHQMEIEIPNSDKPPTEMFDFAGSIAAYAISRGAVIRDGHSVGRGGSEHVLVTHAPSMIDPEITVMRIEY